MSRPRKSDVGLPSCVYERRGAFFLVKRKVWHPLGKNRDAALKLALALGKSRDTTTALQLLRYIGNQVARARANAKGRRAIPFELTRDDALGLMRDSRFRCAVTKAPFSLVLIGRDRPFAPSIDRLNCDEGYSRANCRIVCVATNFAINRWGDAVLHTLFRHWSRGRVLDSLIFGG